jgi:hypothetical protein
MAPSSLPRSPFFDSALHVIKGAVATVLRIKTGGSTERVSQASQGHGGKITISPVDEVSEEQKALIQENVKDKVRILEGYEVYKKIRQNDRDIGV